RDPERPKLVLQPPGHNEGKREDNHRVTEHGGGLCPFPPELFFQRSNKYAPGIQGAQCKIHRESAHDTPPTVQPSAANLNRTNVCCCSCGHLISPFLSRKHVTIEVSCEQ